jgi:hypothetical protein
MAEIKNYQITVAKSQNMNLATQADERLIMNKLEIFI